MLVLTRKAGQNVMIGDDVTVSVIRIQGNRVRIGVEAPSHLGIRREEAQSRSPQERRQLLHSDVSD
jgi:carbon storage regulator